MYKRISFIEEQYSLINKEVHRHIKNLTVISVEKYKEIILNDDFYLKLNPIHEISFIYTEEYFNEFLKYYINYQISYLTDELVTKQIFINSTNPFTNLENQWLIECKQKLIEFYKELLV